MGLRIAVAGLWHLGATTAACLAAAGFRVVATDADPTLTADVAAGRLPVEEPGLADLVRDGVERGALAFETDPAAAVTDVDLLWLAWDTPVDDRDEADVGFVQRQAERLLPALRPATTVLVSSQVPVGFTRGLAAWCAAAGGPAGLRFAYSPENLRLGKALESFRKPARVIVGTDDAQPNETVATVFTPFTRNLVWMSLESAEVTKHALNAFLAMSVAFINEVARLCERYGADAKDVERGLKSEPRIGPGAYLSPGPAFAGGTLARDLRFLHRLGEERRVATPLLGGVLESNDEQGRWLRRKVEELAGRLAGISVAVWGLAYKPGTSTLRRSSALELCRWLTNRGAVVRAHDPAIDRLPDGIGAGIGLAASPVDALAGARVLVVATPWPVYREVTPDAVFAAMATPRVIDEGRFLASTLGGDPRIEYAAVGTPTTGTRGGRS
jgi:UDPglucose 6-dehydrogenase